MKFIFTFFLNLIVFTSMHAASNANFKIENFESKYAPDNYFLDEKGEKLSLETFEDKTILLVFWATWSAPCIKNILQLNSLKKDFKKFDFEIIALSEDFNDLDFLKNFFKTHDLRYLNIYKDINNSLFNEFNIISMPAAIIIQPNGLYNIKITGNINWHDNNLRSLLLSYIDKNASLPKNSYNSNSLDIKNTFRKTPSKIIKKDKII